MSCSKLFNAKFVLGADYVTPTDYAVEQMQVKGEISEPEDPDEDGIVFYSCLKRSLPEPSRGMDDADHADERKYRYSNAPITHRLNKSRGQPVHERLVRTGDP